MPFLLGKAQGFKFFQMLVLLLYVRIVIQETFIFHLFQKLHKQVLVKNQRAFHGCEKLVFQFCIIKQQSDEFFIKVLCFAKHHPFFQFSVVCNEVGFFPELFF